MSLDFEVFLLAKATLYGPFRTEHYYEGYVLPLLPIYPVEYQHISIEDLLS